MKVIAIVFAAILLVAMLAMAALVQLVISLAPFLMVALMVALVLRARRPAVLPPVLRQTVRSHPLRAASTTRYRVGALNAVPGGWVMVPVWVAPPPARTVIDGEVLGDCG